MSTIYRESDSLESEPSPTPTTIPIQINMEEEKKDAFVKNIDEDVNNLTATTDEEDRDPESQKFDRHFIQEEGLVWKGDPTYLPNSPYPEVRSAVSIEDDPTIRLNHWRTWFLTTVFVVVFAGVNQFFSLRYPSLEINFLVAQVVCYPIGRILALLPDWKCSKVPFFDLNPGPFTKKEHAVVTIAVALTSSTAYAMYILNAQGSFYNMKLNVGYQFLLVWTSQMIGYGAAGLTRRWVVNPASSIWPQTLISVSLFDSLHSRKVEKTVANGWTMPRYRFFLIVLIGSFIWYWVPGFLFTGLSYFNVILWGSKTRHNFIANTIFGTQSGLGALPITFDYTQVSQAMSGSVFATPFYVSANTYASVLIFFVIVLPCLYFTNTWYAKYMPVISGSTYDNTQNKYNVTKILNEDYSINLEKYKEYSPVFVPFSYLLSYALNFAAIIAVFVHCILYHGKDIVAKFKDRKNGGTDIHMRIYSKNYKDCPDWWYLLLQIVMIGLGFVAVCCFDTKFPAWAFVIAILISLVNFIPQGILEAMTNQHVGLNIITELICGYMLPLRPMANLLFKLYGFIVMRQGLNLSRDLKLAMYMKVSPRLIFAVQIYATIISGMVNVGVQEWMMHNIDGLCTTDQPNGFTCANGRTVFNASIIWSLPKYLFSSGRIYNPLMWFFLIGLLFPLAVYAVQWKFPKFKFAKHIHTPVFFTGPGNIPPSTPYNYSLFFAMSFCLNLIRKRWRAWFNKYNFVMGAGVEAGVAISVVIIFLCVQYPGGKLSWWGNNVWKRTYDNDYKKFYTLKKGETFGYDKWW
ncbi:ASG_G0027790.mRNA.1.CDS.1 [Saccharomyces cerevisiae]|nr:Opt1p [Saccharomyces cerevisiae YJM320]AJR64236.1 Opt1p [Saccharomyces cerevisiae YJM541]AJR64535.1 Opt1p [Saccharomyces cerevisiae YJM554]AJR73905.1 Opt1p [Saccharomyces cerevisiae YJM1527]AJV39543.1 Opt1p [Saccharomyces cerevisiae YJM1311]AJV40510.1 Opt1p [Saccharomyces cerevisiae YJM1336]AJV40839.1 Opt1p [Saccharomyces cerevisiae YJM1338]AJV41167.1 Opt1p [Saccharomyces cerevisiae YJM1341]AJV42142.1 Opt1p [Saccharomyces cerevisiae YJM1356]KAJ1541359.1 oligopeptide transporter [Sacchar